RYIRFHGLVHPAQLGAAAVQAFLTHLAADRNVAPSTQNQALSALNFLYAQVLQQPFGDLADVVRAKRPQRLPTVLSEEEVARLLRHIDGREWLVACLLYGSGLRLLEALRLRVKDIDFEHRCLLI